jgi:hypothetical protein
LDIREVVVIVWIVVNKLAAINISIDFHGTPKVILTPRFVSKIQSREGRDARGY